MISSFSTSTLTCIYTYNTTTKLRHNQRTFLWKQIERNSIPGQVGFVPLWITLWGAPRQSLWQAGRSRLSRKAPRCSTRLNGQRKRAGRWAAVGFPYGQHRLCGCSRGSFRPTHLSTFRRFGRRLRQRLICPCPG